MVDTDKRAAPTTVPPAPRAVPAATNAAEFTAFYRTSYGDLVRSAIFAGASVEQAHEAADEAMLQVWRSWAAVDEPKAWTRTAVVNIFIKTKQREATRFPRTVRGGHVTPEADNDPGLCVWENRQWVDQLLSKLSSTQHEVMAFIVEGWRPAEVALLLGKDPAAVRKSLQRAVDRLRQLVAEERERERTQTAAPTRRKGEAK